MTYALLAVVFVGVGGLLATVAGRKVSRPGRWWCAVLATAAVLVVLTGVFDNLMIVADLFRYPDSALLGPRIVRAPVEDFAWPVFAALALPALWELVPTLRRSRR